LFAGRYEVEEQIGEGGMGEIYRARDIVKDRQHVAIKVVHHDLSNDEEIAMRFHREMEATSKVRHRNAVRMLAYGSTMHGLAYLVLEYIEGELLSDVLAEEGRLPPRRAVYIARQIVSALKKAHAAGVIHRDLKPENIMICANDAVKIMDFGLARFAEGVRAANITDHGQRIGTPEYMAPEYVALLQPPDHRADLYGLGILLFEMLTGDPPFMGTPRVVFEQHVKTVPPRPSSEEPTVPEWLDHVVSKLLEKKPDERIQSAAEVARLIDAQAPEDTFTSIELVSLIAMLTLVAVTLIILVGVATGMYP
jgi:serine/threonine-protein kinase